jgi:hypothetical protein
MFAQLRCSNSSVTSWQFNCITRLNIYLLSDTRSANKRDKSPSQKYAVTMKFYRNVRWQHRAIIQASTHDTLQLRGFYSPVILPLAP